MEKKIYNLTSAQNSIWLTEQYSSNTSLNNIGGYVFIQDVVNFDNLEKALKLYVKRNDALNLKVQNVDGEPCQYLSEYKDFSIDIVDLKDLNDVKSFNDNIINTPFTFLDSTLYKITMFRLPDGKGGFNATLHHIISDAWNMSLLIDEVMNCYSALCSGKEIDLMPFPSYIDCIESENTYNQSERFKKDEEFWKSIFKDTPELTYISPEKRENTSSVANRKIFDIDANLYCKISEFCKFYNCSIYTFFMAIYSIYLAKVNNSHSSIIGTPVLNRGNYKEKHTAGMFISTVPFKIDANPDVPFTSFLKDVASTQLGIFRHQKYPYDKLLKRIKKEYNISDNLYDFVLSYQNAKDDKNSCDVNYISNWLFNGHSLDTLQVHFYDMDDNGTPKLYYDYQVDKLNETEIISINNRIMNMAKNILETPDMLLKNISIVTNEEAMKLLHNFNSTPYEFDTTKSLVKIFEEQVDINPDKTAIIFEDKILSYSELNKKINALSNVLIENNVGKNNVIGIMLPRSFETIISMWAVLKSGNTYMLIDPSLPKDRIEYMLENANSNLLITNSTFDINCTNKLLLDLSIFLHGTVKENISLSNENINNPEIYNDNNDPFCVIYTSGSTGTPKGVELKRIGIINLVLSHQKILNTNICENFLSTSAVSFDMFIVENFTPLLSGKTVILANEDEQKIPIFLSKLIKKYNVDFILSTPSKISLLLLNDEIGNCLDSVKVLQLGGEIFSEELYKKLKHFAVNSKIYNGYGPSECSACSSFKEVINSKEITIGKPILNTNIYILNIDQNLLPIGYSGQICISGIGVGEGYINNYELTSKSFVNNPYDTALIYQTGDIGKLLSNGDIEYLGRNDNQVKLRGLRIELEEITKKILSISGIKNAISVIKKVNNIDCICSYVISDTTKDEVHIKKYLKDQLPYYMIPSHIIFVDEFPLTINGKVDARQLPDFNNSSVEYIAPQSKLEIDVVNLLKNILKIDTISMNQNFFDLGGDSLAAIKLVSEIYTKFGIKVSIKAVFECNSILEFCNNISNSFTNEKKEILKSSKRASYPLTSAQRGIFYSVSMDNEDSTTYNTPGGIFLNGDLDISKIENCIRILIQRHEALRSYFIIEKGLAVQKIKDDITFNLDVEYADMENLDKIFTNFVKPFDLSNAPLFRIKLICFDKIHYLLLIDIHHIVFDGTSVALFTKELSDLYNGKTLENNTLDYTDYAIFENEQISSPHYNIIKKFWNEKFSGELPILNMPSTYSRPSIRSNKGSEVTATITYAKKIYDFCKENHTTPYVFLLAVYYLLLYKYTNQQDIIIGTVVAGRNNSSFRNILGMFVNTIAIRQNIEPTLKFTEFLNFVNQNVLTCFENDDYPFDELVKDLNITRDLSRNPLFDTMFVYQNEESVDLNLQNIKSDVYVHSTNVSKFDFSLELTPGSDYIKARLEYSTDLFSELFMKQFLDHYLVLISSVLDNTNTNIGNLNMLTTEEFTNVTKMTGNIPLYYDKNIALIKIFEDIVKLNPNQIAIRFNGYSITYDELNKKANQIAHFLSSQGVKSNEIIGILLPRTPNLLYVMLGILKIGAAYMLIDNSLPHDRICYMLENAHSTHLFTDYDFERVDNISPFYIDDIPYQNYSVDNAELSSNNEDPFAIIYTSGSTGLPKGVQLKRLGIINLLYNYQKVLHTTTCKNFLSMSSIAFDMFIVETFIPLLSGGTIILTNEEEQKIPVYTNKLIENENVNFILTTPSRMNLLLDTYHNWNNVKVVQLGGEVFPDNLYEKIKKSAPHSHIFNGYGPTEATACCSSKEIINANDISIGTPFFNTRIYICDKNMNLCPIGVDGEMCISGDGVANGYINNLDLTKKSFVSSPFDNTVLYKTGDMARYMENGEIEYIGRKDFQVKINGLRIELSEIEKQFLTIPNINNVIVICRKDPQPTLIAFFTASDKIETLSIRKQLSSILPSYMIPRYIIQLDTFPITLNGKIDKRELETYKISKEQSSIYTAPRTDLEKLFCSIWKKLLHTEVGIDDDIFDIGADSLLAINFKTQLLSYNINIAYSDIFKYHTIRELASTHKNISDNLTINNDLSKIQTLLDKNIISNLSSMLPTVKSKKNNNILLLGGNGFVGIHILYDFIKNDTGNVYCIIRDKDNETAQARFLRLLHYYFKNELDDYLDKRIFIIRSNILEPNLGLDANAYKKLMDSIDIIINAAAIVKHYGKSEIFKKINIDLTQDLINICIKNSKRLLHISSLSVSGNLSLDGSYQDRTNSANISTDFSENDLYIGQTLNNEYIKSKFLAEKNILENISNNGLQAQILRLGNITNRYSDGLFQINNTENAFYNRIKTFLNLGYIPENLVNMYIEFTPVDICAQAIVILLQNFVQDFCVYHLYDDSHVYMNSLLEIFKSNNIPIEILSVQEFEDRINNILVNTENTTIINGIINDLGPNKQLEYKSNIHIKSDFTKAFLYKFGFSWPKIDVKYLKKYIKYLNS